MRPQDQPVKSSWTATSIGLLSAAIILVAAIAYTFYKEDGARPPIAMDSRPNNEPAGDGPGASPLPLSDSVMQANINLIDGKKTKLADYSGKVLVVDLWATWCGPCQQEIPHLIEIAKEYKDRGVEVLGLTREDPENTSEDVKRFYKDFKINYPIGWTDDEMEQELMRGRGAIPQTYIIGRDGKVLRHFVGFSRTIVPEMKAALEAAPPAG
ncbi:MAG: TlpA family protein disulfide reductase [Chloracidobacterium sp.]|nr:TlpA family protein disulfide reductase [Chloracidobacterium sp.]